MLIKTEGIVLRSIKYGEGSKIITVYTKSHGKVALMAKGALKPKSRFHAVTQIFSYAEYVYYMGKDMGNLNQGEMQSHFTDIYLDIEKTAYAAYIVELVDKLTNQNEANMFLFSQLLASIEQINQGKDFEIVTRIFEMKIFQLSGYKPHLYSCSICGNQEELVSFSVKNGGVICRKHREEQGIPLHHATVKLLRLFDQMDINRLGNVEVKKETKKQLQQITRAFYDEYIGIPLKSRNFLDQMKNIS